MDGVIKNFRRGRNTQQNNQIIIELKSVKGKRAAGQLIGRKVKWKTSSGKILTGQISGAHGNSGAVRARFDKGFPPAGLGTKIKIV